MRNHLAGRSGLLCILGAPLRVGSPTHAAHLQCPVLADQRPWHLGSTEILVSGGYLEGLTSSTRPVDDHHVTAQTVPSSWMIGLSTLGNHDLSGVMNATAAPDTSTATPNLPIPGMLRGGVTTSPPNATAFLAVPSQSGTAT